MTRRSIERVAVDCGWKRLTDLEGTNLEQWIVSRNEEGMSAGTCNNYRKSCVAFGNWCKRVKRLAENPFQYVSMLDAKANWVRRRRALTEEELGKLLDTARRRPLLAAMTIRRGKRKGQAVAKVKEENRRKLEQLGRERELLYKTLVLTGLRKEELTSLTVGHLFLDGATPYVDLEARDEKNRQGTHIPLRADLVAEIRSWLEVKLVMLQGKARGAGTSMPTRLPASTPVFYVPTGFIRILDRDLKLAEIPKRDERGYTVDIHAMRHTFGTLLSVGGTTPRTAQAAMRHSDISLTMGVYTDPKLLDITGALNTLPDLPLGESDVTKKERATGTLGNAKNEPHLVAPLVAPAPDFSCSQGHSLSHIDDDLENRKTDDTTDSQRGCSFRRARSLTKSHPLVAPLSGDDNGCLRERPMGIEPTTFSLGSCESSTPSGGFKEVTTPGSTGCTTGCTSQSKSTQATLLEVVATMLQLLSPEDKAKLVKSMLEDEPSPE